MLTESAQLQGSSSFSCRVSLSEEHGVDSRGGSIVGLWGGCGKGLGSI